jgi:2-polyprenyl-3-methyl-5-hydroxy-6-metoxy-1,4-benzoquinol methylase
MWNEWYGKPGYVYGTNPNDFLVSVASRIPQGRILCLGEGEGRNAVYLASLGYEVFAVDQSEVGLAKAEKLAAQQGVKIKSIVADLADFIIKPKSWQGVVSIFCHLPTALWEQVHRDAVAGLTPGGMWVLEAYTPRQLEFGTGGPSNLDMLVSLETVKSKLEGLDWKIAQELDREVIEGAHRSGMGAVVQILGEAY